MQMPMELSNAVERLLSDMPQTAVRDAASALSDRYRTDEKAPKGVRLLGSEDEMRAYCAFRMPATYATLMRSMALMLDCGVAGIRTLTDVGSGTGSALWAAMGSFDTLEEANLYERESGMIALAKQLYEGNGDVRAEWTQGDMLTANLKPADLVTASFCLGELKAEDADKMVRRLWEAADKALLIVEPGTPAGSARIRHYLDILRDLGAHMAAPCPSMAACPVGDTDWCHFSVRIERTRLQRYLKDGSLPYEDEKFAFLAVTKTPVQPASLRVRRHPMIRSGFVELPVCKEGGVEVVKVTKKHPHYKAARKLDTGDRWE